MKSLDVVCIFFSDNMGDLSEEHGDRYHQDISTMERRYQGRRYQGTSSMMGVYLWGFSI